MRVEAFTAEDIKDDPSIGLHLCEVIPVILHGTVSPELIDILTELKAKGRHDDVEMCAGYIGMMMSRWPSTGAHRL